MSQILFAHLTFFSHCCYLVSTFTKMVPLTLLTIILAAGIVGKNVMAQNCGCAADFCCSQHGYCGKGDEYCGTGCQQGPCYASTSGVSVPDIVTPQFFNGIIKQDPTCPGMSFYTRDAFLDALNSFSEFGKLGSVDDSKREIAAFFAHTTHETGHYCFTEESDKSNNHCNPQISEYPCAPGKSYYGRGPIQLTGNENYGKAGRSLNLDLLRSPETVATDRVVSFKTALWYWMVAVRPVVNKGFGATINAINGPVECGGREPEKVQSRIALYTEYCKQLGVATGDNLSC